MTLTQLKNSVYNISTILFIPHPVSFSLSFSQNSGLVQLMLTPVAIWSNIYEVWVWLKERLMIVSCSPVNMSGLISEWTTLTLLQADFESKYILRVSLANRKSPRQFTVFFFFSSAYIIINSILIQIKLLLTNVLKYNPSFLCATPKCWPQFSARIGTLNLTVLYQQRTSNQD